MHLILQNRTVIYEGPAILTEKIAALAQQFHDRFGELTCTFVSPYHRITYDKQTKVMTIKELSKCPHLMYV